MATKITIADLFPDEKGMILVAEDTIDGSLRHISEVANGAACGCRCFGCKKPMIARNGGGIVAHHFAHRAEDMVVDCVTAGETALHIRAKEIIAEYRRVTLPATSLPGIDGKPLEVSPERSIDLTDIRLEAVAGELIPDVTATMPDGRRIFIEIANTHLCPPEKKEKLGLMDVDVLEIMVSAYRSVPLDELDEIILDIAPRQLIHSAEVKTIAAQIAEDRQKQDEAKRAEAKRLVSAYRAGEPLHHNQAQKLVDIMVRRGLSRHLDLEDNGPSAFIVYRRHWQAAIFERLFQNDYDEAVTVYDIAEGWKERWTKPELRYVKSDHSRWIAEEIAEDFKSPHEEISAYLARLQAAEVVHKTARGGKYYMQHVLKENIKAIIKKEGLPAKRKGEILNAYNAIDNLMGADDGKLGPFDEWLKTRAVEYGVRVQTLLSSDGEAFHGLMARLRSIPAAAIDMKRSHGNAPPEDLVGLPLQRLFERLRIDRDAAREREEAERAARRERAAIETAERLARESAERVSELETAAIFSVDDVEAFLGSPLPDQDGKTPREMAAESVGGLVAAQLAIQKIRDAKQAAASAERLRKDMVEKLWERVYHRIPRRDVADLWPIQRWPELGGVKPIEFCTDKKTLERCFEVLEDFVKTQQRRGRR